MPSLTVETSGLRRGGVITSRVLIGRLPTNGVVLAESSVSRLHAWIDCDLEGLYYVADTGSLTGTWVNNKAVDRRQALHDHDVIRVGKTLLTFHETNDIEPDVQPINLAGYPPLEDVDQAGVLFECVCGAPAWFKATAIGQSHKCKQCGRSVTIPDKPGVRAHPIGEPVGTPEVVAAHGLAESYTSQAATEGGELHRPYEEHGLADSYAGQTAVAEPETHTAVHPEHGLAEIETAPETGFESAYTTESSPAHEAEPHAAEDESSFEPEASSPTLEQMLEAEVEPPTEEHVAEESYIESPAIEPAAPEPISFQHVEHDARVEHAIEHAAEEVVTPMAEYTEAAPTERMTAAHDDVVVPPVEERAVSEETSMPAGRPSLFASRRRPIIEPGPALDEESHLVGMPVESASPAPAEAGPLDAFDGYGAEHGSASVTAEESLATPSHDRAGESTGQVPFEAQDEEMSGARTCSVCNTAIAANEATTTCPSCGLTFHAECWNENQGCSAYGCPQVGALAPKEEPQAVEQTASDAPAVPYDPAEPDEPFPWEYLYLAASIVGTLLGLLVFGVPSLIAAIGTLIYKIRFPDPARRNGVVTLSILLALLGVGLGIVASIYWWFGGFAGLNLGRPRGK